MLPARIPQVLGATIILPALCAAVVGSFTTIAAAQTAAPAVPQSEPLDNELKSLRDRVQSLQQEKDVLQKSLETEKAQLKSVSESKKAAEAQLKAAKDETRAKAANELSNALNQTKYIEVGVGILPNSDKKVNNFAKLKGNYSPHWDSSFIFSSRNLGSSATKSETTPGAAGIKEIKVDSEATVSTNTMRMELNVLEFKPSDITLGGLSLSPAFAAGVDQLRDRRERNINGRHAFTDPKSGKNRVILTTSKIVEESVSTLPRLGFDLTARGDHLALSGGAGLLVANRERFTWDERGSAYFPPLTIDSNAKTEVASQVAESDSSRVNRFGSNGYKAHLDLTWSGQDHGFGLHFESIAKKGEREIYNVETKPVEPDVDGVTGQVKNEGEQKRVVVESKATETRTQTLLGLSWTLSFMKDYGLIPELRLNMQTDSVKTAGGGVSDTEEARQYDFGVVFNY